MGKCILITVFTAVSLPLLAQETTEVRRTESSVPEATSSSDKNNPHRMHSKEQRSAFKKRQLKLMEKALNEIGVTDEQREQIHALQSEHMKKMRANWKRMNTARSELSHLQDSGASMDELSAAIKEVSDAQAEQLHILVVNRKEMENILGKKKNDLLMQKANEYFRKHGRRPGAGMPPHPKTPPAPTDSGNVNQAPPPPPA